MAFDKKFELRLYPAPNREVSGDMPNKWSDNLGNSAQLMLDRQMAKMPTDGAFFDILANPSTNEYANVLNPAYRSKGGRTTEVIKALRQKKLAGSFSKWVSKLTEKLGNGATAFKAAVANAKDWWALKMGATTLRFTGDKVRGRGPATVATAFMVGEAHATGWLAEGDYQDGAPYDIARDGEEPVLKAALEQRLVQSGLFADYAGTDSVRLAQNTLNASVLNGLRDILKCDAFVLTTGADKCFCIWAVDAEARLYLHVQLGLTTP